MNIPVLKPSTRETLAPNYEMVPVHICEGLEKWWIDRKVCIFVTHMLNRDIAQAWYDEIVRTGTEEHNLDLPWFDIYDHRDGELLMTFPQYLRAKTHDLIQLGDDMPGATAIVVRNPLAGLAMTTFFMEHSQHMRVRRIFDNFEDAYTWIRGLADQFYTQLEIRLNEEI